VYTVVQCGAQNDVRVAVQKYSVNYQEIKEQVSTELEKIVVHEISICCVALQELRAMWYIAKVMLYKS
jgi:hypothetical protein